MTPRSGNRRHRIAEFPDSLDAVVQPPSKKFHGKAVSRELAVISGRSGNASACELISSRLVSTFSLGKADNGVKFEDDPFRAKVAIRQIVGSETRMR